MRGKKPQQRKTLPDYQYESMMVTQLINYVMQDGKKTIAMDIVYGALDKIDLKSLKVKEDHEARDSQDKTEKAEMKHELSRLEVLETALNNVKPRLEIRSRRIGGANYQIPVPVSPERQTALALRWMVTGARDKRKNTDLAQALANEIVAAYNNEGTAIKKKEDTQKMAEANKAFAQFA